MRLDCVEIVLPLADAWQARTSEATRWAMAQQAARPGENCRNRGPGVHCACGEPEALLARGGGGASLTIDHKALAAFVADNH